MSDIIKNALEASIERFQRDNDKIAALMDQLLAANLEIMRMRAEWIDPQRLVDLAKRYTDEGRVGYVEVAFYDHVAEHERWLVYYGRGEQSYAANFGDALKAAEA